MEPTCGEVSQETKLPICSPDEACEAALRSSQRLQILCCLHGVQLSKLCLHLLQRLEAKMITFAIACLCQRERGS